MSPLPQFPVAVAVQGGATAKYVQIAHNEPQNCYLLTVSLEPENAAAAAAAPVWHRAGGGHDESVPNNQREREAPPAPITTLATVRLHKDAEFSFDGFASLSCAIVLAGGASSEWFPVKQMLSRSQRSFTVQLCGNNTASSTSTSSFSSSSSSSSSSYYYLCVDAEPAKLLLAVRFYGCLPTVRTALSALSLLTSAEGSKDPTQTAHRQATTEELHRLALVYLPHSSIEGTSANSLWNRRYLETWLATPQELLRSPDWLLVTRWLTSSSFTLSLALQVIEHERSVDGHGRGGASSHATPSSSASPQFGHTQTAYGALRAAWKWVLMEASWRIAALERLQIRLKHGWEQGKWVHHADPHLTLLGCIHWVARHLFHEGDRWYAVPVEAAAATGEKIGKASVDGPPSFQDTSYQQQQRSRSPNPSNASRSATPPPPYPGGASQMPSSSSTSRSPSRAGFGDGGRSSNLFDFFLSNVEEFMKGINLAVPPSSYSSADTNGSNVNQASNRQSSAAGAAGAAGAGAPSGGDADSEHAANGWHQFNASKSRLLARLRDLFVSQMDSATRAAQMSNSIFSDFDMNATHPRKGDIKSDATTVGGGGGQQHDADDTDSTNRLSGEYALAYELRDRLREIFTEIKNQAGGLDSQGRTQPLPKDPCEMLALASKHLGIIEREIQRCWKGYVLRVGAHRWSRQVAERDLPRKEQSAMHKAENLPVFDPNHQQHQDSARWLYLELMAEAAGRSSHATSATSSHAGRGRVPSEFGSETATYRPGHFHLPLDWALESGVLRANGSRSGKASLVQLIRLLHAELSDRASPQVVLDADVKTALMELQRHTMDFVGWLQSRLLDPVQSSELRSERKRLNQKAELLNEIFEVSETSQA